MYGVAGRCLRLFGKLTQCRAPAFEHLLRDGDLGAELRTGLGRIENVLMTPFKIIVAVAGALVLVFVVLIVVVDRFVLTPTH